MGGNLKNITRYKNDEVLVTSFHKLSIIPLQFRINLLKSNYNLLSRNEDYPIKWPHLRIYFSDYFNGSQNQIAAQRNQRGQGMPSNRPTGMASGFLLVSTFLTVYGCKKCFLIWEDQVAFCRETFPTFSSVSPAISPSPFSSLAADQPYPGHSHLADYRVASSRCTWIHPPHQVHPVSSIQGIRGSPSQRANTLW